MKALQSDSVNLHSLLTSTDELSTLRPVISSTVKQNINTKVMLLSLSLWGLLLWFEQQHVPVECGWNHWCSFCLCCVAFSTQHRVPKVTGWLTRSNTASVINIWAARCCLSSPFMLLWSSFLLLGQMPGHVMLFETRSLRWSTISN